MKKKTNLLTVFGILATFVIGFLIGITIEYPKVGDDEISGTIGKVNNYRNTKATEADIQLKNELLADSAKQKSLQKYLNFYYVTALKMAGDIDFAVKEANAVEDFKRINQTQISNLDSYGKLLSKARTDLLFALSASKTIKDVDPALLRDLLNKASNMVAQMNYRNRSVLGFIDAVALFSKPNSSTEYEGMKRAHDILSLNEINTSVLTGNKPVLKFFDKKAFFNNVQELNWADPKNLNDMMQQDIEKLGAVEMDVEKLGSVHLDAEILGRIMDAEILGFVCDMEKLQLIDAERLEGCIVDAEKLNIYVDAEKLGIIVPM